jgi:hypothetical protein
MREAGGEIARRANQLLADTEGQRPPTSEPSSLKLHSCRGLLRCTPARSAVPPRPSGGILASGDDVKSVPASRHRRCCSARTVQPEPGG